MVLCNTTVLNAITQPKATAIALGVKISKFVAEKVGNTAIGKAISNGYDKFKETAVGGAIVKFANAVGKVLTSEPMKFAAKTALAIITAVATVAAVANPVGAAIVIGATVVGGVIEIAQKTKEARENRKLVQEHKALTNIGNDAAKQQELLAQKPSLTSLKGYLEKIEREKPVTPDKKSVTELHKVDGKGKTIAKSVGDVAKGVVIDKGLEVAKDAAVTSLSEAGKALISNPTPIGLIKAGAALILGIKDVIEKREKVNEIKNDINEMRLKTGAPKYDDITELKKAAREQEIQTKALEKCANDKNFGSLHPQDQVKQFELTKKEIAKETPEVKEPEKGLGGWLKSVVKDLGRTLNPFSKYSESITDIELTKKSGLAKGQENIAKKQEQAIQPKENTKPLDQQVAKTESKTVEQIKTTNTPKGPSNEMKEAFAKLDAFETKMNEKISGKTSTL